MTILCLFYIFCYLALFFATLIISLQNTVYAVFSLILVFFCIFCILICLGVTEFLAIIILIVYIGAVSILFLFTVMMLGAGNKETNYKNKSLGIYSKIPKGLKDLRVKLLCLCLFYILFFIYKDFIKAISLFGKCSGGGTPLLPRAVYDFISEITPFNETLVDIHNYLNRVYLFQKDVDFAFLINFYSNDISIFGSLLYTECSELFFLITFVMLVTLVGSLVLALSYYKPSTIKDFLK